MFRIVFAAAALAAALPSLASANANLVTQEVTVAWSEATAHAQNLQNQDRPTPGPSLLVADGGQQSHDAMSHGTMADTAMSDGSYSVGDLVVETPWSRASAGGAGSGGAFMTIRNAGHDGDRLIAADAEIAGLVQVHMTLMDEGVMRMRHAEDGVEIPAGDMAELKPGGFHVMLMGLHGPLEEGASFPLTLTFERAGAITVDVQIQAAGAMGAGMQHNH